MGGIVTPGQGRNLDRGFYERSALDVAAALLGKRIVFTPPGEPLRAGRIVETEAYMDDDPAFIGWRARFGPEGRVVPAGRVARLFGPPGTIYLYRVFGRNLLMNIRTGRSDRAACVLIRAVEPVAGEGVLRARRKGVARRTEWTNGPAKWVQAFGIDASWQDDDLTRGSLRIEQPGPAGEAPEVVAVGRSGRIGIRHGADLPYRFYELGNRFVSRGRPKNPDPN